MKQDQGTRGLESSGDAPSLSTGGETGASSHSPSPSLSANGAQPSSAESTSTLSTAEAGAPSWIVEETKNPAPKCALHAVAAGELSACVAEVPKPSEGWDYGCANVLFFAVNRAEETAHPLLAVPDCMTLPQMGGDLQYTCELADNGRPTALQLCPESCNTAQSQLLYVGVGFEVRYVREAEAHAGCQFDQ